LRQAKDVSLARSKNSQIEYRSQHRTADGGNLGLNRFIKGCFLEKVLKRLYIDQVTSADLFNACHSNVIAAINPVLPLRQSWPFVLFAVFPERDKMLHMFTSFSYQIQADHGTIRNIFAIKYCE
jgi:hypothetical protein